MRHIYRLALMLVAFTSIYSHAFAQCDPVFRPDSTQWGYNGMVATSTKVGNTLYVGGVFTRMYKSTGTFVGLNAASGNPVTLSWPQVVGTVNAVISDGSNGFIIAGNIFTVGSVTRNGIAQINSAGQLTSWNPNANGTINTLYRVGTTIYVGGDFTTIGGQARNRIAALSLSTGLATSWNPNANGTVKKIIANTTGTVIYVGGTYTTIGGQSRNNIAAIDATTGLATSWNPNANNTVNTMMLNGTTLYAGGPFTSIGGQSRTNAGAVNTSTGLATGWNPSPNGVVNDMIMSGTTNIFVGGVFSTIGSQSRNSLAEVDASVGNATSTNYLLPSSSIITGIKLSGTNDLFVCGGFTLSSGKENIIKINKALGTITTWEGNITGSGTPMAMDFNSAGNVFVGGAISSYYKIRNRVAAIDMITDTVLPWNPVVNTQVNAIAANTSTVYLGGGFSQVGGLTRNNLASVDAVTGAVSTWNPAPNNEVTSLVLNGNSLYVGGNFTVISSISRNRLALYDITTSTLTTSWNPNVNAKINAMALSGTQLIIGGSFSAVSSVTRNRIASVDLSSGAATGWNPNSDGDINALAIGGTTIYVGGGFNNIGGQFRPRLAELDILTGNATSWIPYPSGPGATIWSVAVNGGRVYAGGAYTSIGGQTRTNFAAVDIFSGNATSWDPAPDNSVTHIGIYNGRMLVGGVFSNISGSAKPFGVQYKLLETAPSVTITGKSSMCASTSATYTATTDVTGVSYQWKRNGLNVGTNSPTYTVVPSNNDQIQCVITAPAGCYNPLTATSNTITVSIVSAVTPTVNVVTSANPSCSGTAVTYTASTNVSNPTYAWSVNGNNTSTSGNVFTYTPTNGDVISATVNTPSEGCYTTTSVTQNTNQTVNTPVAPTITISTTSTTVCAGASVTFTSTSNVTGGSYQWKRNGLNVGTNNSSFTTTTLVNGDAITCVITIPVGGCFTASTGTSNQINMTVNANVVPTLSIAGNTTPCTGSSTTYTATTNVTSASYQWKLNGGNVGTNSSTYTVIPAANDVITCVVTTPVGSCYTVSTVTSNSLTITPQAVVTPTVSITGSNPVCQGSSGTYTATTNIVNGSYQWKVNTVNSSTSTSFSYTPANNDAVTLTITTPVGQGCYSTGSASSNTVTVTVTPPAVPNASIAITNPAVTGSTVCSGIPVTYTASSTTITGGSYQWKVNGFNVGTNSSTFTYTPSNGDVVTCVITVPTGGCFTVTTATSNALTMTVTPSIPATISIAESANNICAGNTVGFTSSTNVTGGNYQWTVNSSNIGTNSATLTYVPSNNDVVTCTISGGSGCYTTPSTTSNAITMLVQTPVVPQVSVTPSANNICSGRTVKFKATTNVTSPFYQWKVNSATVGTSDSVYSYAPIDNDIVLCIISTAGGCYTAPTASSIFVVMKVTASAADTFSIAGPGIAAIGSTVTVNAQVQSSVTNYTIEWKNKGVTFATTTNVASTTYTKTAGIDTITATITPVSCYAIVTAQPVYIHGVNTGIDKVNGKTISVYPNPFADYVKVNGLDKGDEVSLYDITGRKLQSWTVEVNQAENTFNINAVPGGSYILRIHDQENHQKGNFPLQKL